MFIATPLACGLVLNEFSVEIIIFVCSADPTNPFKFEQFSVNADFVLLI